MSVPTENIRLIQPLFFQQNLIKGIFTVVEKKIKRTNKGEGGIQYLAQKEIFISPKLEGARRGSIGGWDFPKRTTVKDRHNHLKSHSYQGEQAREEIFRLLSSVLQTQLEVRGQEILTNVVYRG